jgi:hypothetical protein
VILFEHGKDLPEVRMNNVIVIQKVDHSFINVHKSNISLTVSRTGSRRTHMTILDDLRMGKNLVVDPLGLGGIVNNDPPMNLVHIKRLIDLF